VQHAAHNLLSSIGVPDTPAARKAAAGVPQGGPPPPAAPAGGGRGQAGATAPQTGEPSAPDVAPGGVIVSVAQATIPAGGSDTFTVRLTGSGVTAAAGEPVQLLEQAAGTVGWQVAGQARTGPDGIAQLVARDLTRNAWFTVTGPGGARGVPVEVTVVPLVTVSVSMDETGPPVAVLTAVVTFGSPGDEVILQRLTDGQWLSVGVRSLGLDGRAAFVVPGPAVPAGSAWRVLLAATTAHGAAVSGPVQA
jgi:hypothetical protein